jgi:hypothetical protein
MEERSTWFVLGRRDGCRIIAERSRWFVLGRREMAVGVWRKDARKRNHSEDLDVDERITLKRIFNKSL